MSKKEHNPVHPGEVLLEEFLIPLGLSQNALARGLGVPPRRINEIVHGNRRVTADTALRLGLYFGNSPEFWLGLQMDFELDVESDRLGDRLEKEVQRRRSAG
ncbi:MAG: addiction module antidote protein, HigA family [Planctomycetota bacterium]|nr:MAG: addiction module antidote protein, HigA family [Planctomycetota bacterium]